jgi:hypothetical protein
MEHFVNVVNEFEDLHGQITEIIHGGARGADYMAEIVYIYWVEEGKRQIKRTCIDADWETHGKRAGPIRNQQLVDLKPDWCIPMPGGKGTEDCIKRCKKAGIPLFIR